jgi:hypothetical protein
LIRIELNRTKDLFLASENGRRDISILYAEHAKQSEKKAMECVNNVLERVFLEREEILSRLHSVREAEDIRLNITTI